MMSVEIYTKEKNIEYGEPSWTTLPDGITLTIFSFLGIKSLSQASLVCRSWLRLAFDEILWKNLFYRHWGIRRSIPMSPEKQSWVEEYKRLLYHTPCIESEVFKEHKDEVLHVSFSHNGKMFATTSKDSSVKVWNLDYPVKLKFEADMKQCNFQHTQFSQFNNSDSLLLVSGPKAGALSTDCLGLIIVFSLEGVFVPLQTLLTAPFDTNGQWYNDHFILHGRQKKLSHLEHSSDVCLSKVWPKFMSEKESMMTRLFKIKNVNASFVRSLMVAHCFQRNGIVSEQTDTEQDSDCKSNSLQAMKNMKYMEWDDDTETTENEKEKQTMKQDNTFKNDVVENAQEIDYVNSYPTSMVDMGNSEPNEIALDEEQINRKRNIEAEHSGHTEDSTELNDKNQSITLNSSESRRVEFELDKESNQMLMNIQSMQIQECIRAAMKKFNRRDHSEQETQSKNCSSTASSTAEYDCIIFTTGSKAYTPHQIGIKKVKPLHNGNPEKKHGINVNENADIYDELDRIFDMEGHITGMCVSPDQRYLYVNCRAWPEDYHIADPYEPPLISNDIDMHVIDLWQMRDLGVVHRGHKAYTINHECFYTHLDVAEDYVASGAEDKQGYLWDRHYSICVRNFPHDDVVNSVAFNPTDPEVLVTVSDDWSIKIWRSLNRQKQVVDSELN